LVVDDEVNIGEVVRLYLEHADYEPLILHRGDKVVETIQQSAPIMALLDVMLPDISGFELCRQIRGLPQPYCAIPIILLTAKGESIDKLRGFNLGADDYIVKPFDPNELVARVKAVLRRTSAPAPMELAETKETRKTLLNIGSLWIDLDKYRVTVDGHRVDLTPKEIELLHFIASNPRRVFTREDLLAHVWNFDFIGGTRTVDAHIKNLRKKLGANKGWSIQTLWGIGYSFEVHGDA
jgi:DNA-binding response OmpR family regulator